MTPAVARAFDLQTRNQGYSSHRRDLHQIPQVGLRAAHHMLWRNRELPMAQDPGADQLDHSREGRYANHFHIGYNAFEMILRFGQFYEGNTQPVMHTTIITSPAYLENLLHLLDSTLAQYKESFGDLTRRPHE